jgi:3-oxoacyl-[acyl-carrier protein] reductase
MEPKKWETMSERERNAMIDECFAYDGVRVLCLQPNAVPESTALLRSIAQHAKAKGVEVQELLASMANGTLLRRLPTLEEVADVASFVASDRARIMTGTIVKLNCGAEVD